MTAKTDLTIYREARVERRFTNHVYWISMHGFAGCRDLMISQSEKPLELGQLIIVWWHRTGRIWIKE
jgi:hypothetical protein